MFLMTHQTFGGVLHNPIQKTQKCCKKGSDQKSCCKKTRLCDQTQCCSYIASASVAVLQESLDLGIMTKYTSSKQQNTFSNSFVRSLSYSIWQPPKISLNL